MKHGKKNNKKFSRLRGARISFMRNLGNDLIRAGKIETTETRAKAIRPRVESLVTFAKNPTVANRRLVSSRVGNDKIVKEIIQRLRAEVCRAEGRLFAHHETGARAASATAPAWRALNLYNRVH